MVMVRASRVAGNANSFSQRCPLEQAKLLKEKDEQWMNDESLNPFIKSK